MPEGAPAAAPRSEPSAAAGAPAPAAGARARAAAAAARRAAIAGLLAVPFAAVAIGARALADRTARSVGPALAAYAEAAMPEERAAAAASRAEDPGVGDPAPIQLPYFVGEPVPPPRPKEAKGKVVPAAPRGVLVRADVVARAVRSGMRPSGTSVPASGGRPAGMALAGASGFGTGLRDGDVVTSVAGAPATSEGAVVAAVAAALRAKAKAISAVVWRGDQRINVTVEIPRTSGKKKSKKRGTAAR